MIKSILKWALGIIGAAAIGLGVVHAVKMGTDENYRTHINAAWGIEQTVEDEDAEGPGEEVQYPEDENGDDVIDVPVTGGEGTTAPHPGLDEPIEDETTEE